jgi:hypothetical protein
LHRRDAGEFLRATHALKIALEIGTERRNGTLVAKRVRELANFLGVLFEEEIGAKLGVDFFRKGGVQRVLREAVGGVPVAAIEFGRATEESQRGVDTVGRNGGDRRDFVEEENFVGGGVADRGEFLQGFLCFGQRALQNRAHVSGKFFEDARGDFLQAKRGEFGLHDAGAHDFAQFGVGCVEDFLRGEADFGFQRAEAFVATFVGLRIAAIAMKKHFVRIGGVRRFWFSVELFEAMENRGETGGLRGRFGHDERWNRNIERRCLVNWPRLASESPQRSSWADAFLYYITVILLDRYRSRS